MDFGTLDQYIADNLSPLIYPRWTFTGFLLLLYIRRILRIKTHSVVTYFVGVYLLHATILFLTPKDENIPDPFENTEDESYNPRNIDNDFRPYVRRLPEFDFWKMCSQIIAVAFFITYFPFLDLPVYAPILVLYFIFIVSITCYKLWMHSKKFRYNLFFISKSSLEQ
ncbi:uncharacterized protein VICG_00155 [Vittaforma corneae ATCC 50505]|uniref:Protein RER1 n=1 Tax=Vittaforma corneae (strain ATCC 50505) TaxID=993615 RepID=L2GQP6_VITCO|nr:uncharacterized protein VICG_00155 [Vittaforma corneae ATCC 50505]ELA42840.1 hypothetical protein VICG_00155 [Vittaforma corneae ATCC 50505]